MAGEGKFIDNLMANNLVADGAIKGTAAACAFTLVTQA